jgi:hypothetical protein
MGCSHSKQELQRRKNMRAVSPGSSERTFFSNYTTPGLSFAAALHSSKKYHQQQPSQHLQQQSTKHNREVTSQTSDQSVQAKNVNRNSMGDISVAFTMVQQIMTDLSGVATEEEKVAVITRAVFHMLKLNAGSC